MTKSKFNQESERHTKLWDTDERNWTKTQINWKIFFICGSKDLVVLDCPLEKAMAPHSSTLAWKIPWTKEPGRLQSMGWLRVGHDWATSLSLFTFMHWRRKWQPTPVFLPGNPRDGGAWWATINGVAQSQTRLKWLSSSSSSMKLNVSAGLLDTYYLYHDYLWESFTSV